MFIPDVTFDSRKANLYLLYSLVAAVLSFEHRWPCMWSSYIAFIRARVTVSVVCFSNNVKTSWRLLHLPFVSPTENLDASWSALNFLICWNRWSSYGHLSFLKYVTTATTNGNCSKTFLRFFVGKNCEQRYLPNQDKN